MATTDHAVIQVEKVQDAAAQKSLESAREVDKGKDLPFMHAVPHTIQSLAVGTTRFEHKLGRTPRGWWLTDCSGGPPLVYRSAMDASVIVLENAGAVPLGVSFWVF